MDYPSDLLNLCLALQDVVLADFKPFLHIKVVEVDQATKIAFVRLVSQTCGWINKVGIQ